MKAKNIKLSRKNIIIIAIVVFVLSYISYYFLSIYSLNTYTVAQGSIIQNVSETGRVVSEQDYNLSFKTSGRVSAVFVGTGSKVEKGQALMELDKKELEIQLNQAIAKKITAQAKLNQLVAGATNEEVSVYESVVANAEISVANAAVAVNDSEIALNNAKKNLIDTIQDDYTKSDNAIRNSVDQLFSNPRGPNPQIVFAISDRDLEATIESQRISIEIMLNSWKSSLDELALLSDFDLYITEARQNLNQIKSFLDKVAFAINGATNANLSQTFDGWKKDVADTRITINEALNNLLSAEEKMNEMQSVNNTAEGNLKETEGALEKAKDDLEFIKAAPRDIDTAVFESQVNTANIAIALIQKNLDDIELRAPDDGIITNISIERGERVAANQTIISLIGESRFELEVYISEESITKIKEGGLIEFTLDAFSSNNKFNGKIVLIEPAATIIEEEVYYKVRGRIAEDIVGVREGMTSDVDIIIEKKDNVLLVPAEAIEETDGNERVLVLAGSIKKESRIIETGLRGGGFVEIVSGLSEGEIVIIR